MNAIMKTKIMLWMVILAVLLIACSAPALPQAAQPSATSTPLAAAQFDPTSTPAATAQPTAGAAQSGDSRFAYGNVSFVLDPSVAASASGQTVPEKAQSNDGPYWEVNPEYTKISLAGYTHLPAALEPVIAVYPVEAFRKLSPGASQIIDTLQAFLAGSDTDARQLPFLPIWNAGQIFHANTQRLAFQNGSGVRFLTEYAQYPAPVNSKDLFYTFQGLTSDGKYYISMVLPAGHPSLPASPEALSQSEMESIARNAAYYPDMASKLSALPGDSYTPDLGKLDALVQSLKIEK